MLRIEASVSINSAHNSGGLRPGPFKPVPAVTKPIKELPISLAVSAIADYASLL